VTAPDWSDAALADLARDYPADAHDDVADLIAGVRRLLALVEAHENPDGAWRAITPGGGVPMWTHLVRRALNHPEETP